MENNCNRGILGFVDGTDNEDSAWYDFSTYWNQIKSKISDILMHGARLISLKRKYDILYTRALRVGRDDLAAKAESSSGFLMSLIIKWQKIRHTIMKWLPKWKSASSGNGLSGLGSPVLILLGIAGIAAAGFVAVYAIDYYKEYKEAKLPYQALKDEIITAEQAKGIIGAGVLPSFTEKIGSIAMIAAVTIGGMFLYKTFKKRKK